VIKTTPKGCLEHCWRCLRAHPSARIVRSLEAARHSTPPHHTSHTAHLAVRHSNKRQPSQPKPRPQLKHHPPPKKPATGNATNGQLTDHRARQSADGARASSNCKHLEGHSASAQQRRARAPGTSATATAQPKTPQHCHPPHSHPSGESPRQHAETHPANIQRHVATVQPASQHTSRQTPQRTTPVKRFVAPASAEAAWACKSTMEFF
jgi:hypothetical protein